MSKSITRGRVTGMSCQHCVRAVFTALGAVEGITRADVRVGSLEVEHLAGVSFEEIRDAVAVAGYTVVDPEISRRVLPVVSSSAPG